MSISAPRGLSSRLGRRAFLAGAAAALALPSFVAAQEQRVTRPRVGLQAGHWRSADLPDELARLRPQTGTYGGGLNEWQLNLNVARLAAEILESEGIDVDVLPATIPPRYRADAFVALHADGDASGRMSGFKLARASRSLIPHIDDRLLEAVQTAYADASGLPLDDHISRGMLGYYAFSSRRFQHAIDPATPAVILEMGFMTNWSDLRVLLNRQDALALGVARGVLRFLAAREGASA